MNPTVTPVAALLPTQVSATSIASVAQGEAVTFATTLYSPTEQKNICGAPNYYIGNYAAGGKWNINAPGTCSASSGSLSLAGADTAKRSLGTHTLKVDYLGDSTHSGSQFSEQFTLTANPSPSPIPGSFVGDSQTKVYHYPTCPDALRIKPQNRVTFPTAAAAVAAGYRPCKHCNPPTS